MKSSDFSDDNRLEVELVPTTLVNGTLQVDEDRKRVIIPRTGPTNPYYERFDIPLDDFVGDARLAVNLRFKYWGDSGAWIRLDELAIRELGGVRSAALPVTVRVPNDRMVVETGGWGVLEEPLGTPLFEVRPKVSS